MNESLIKKMLRDKFFSVFLTGLGLALLVGTFFWCYSVLKTLYVIDEITDQNLNNKKVVLSQTASNRDKENLSQPGEIAAPQAPSERVEKALLAVDTVSAVGAKPIIDKNKISQQIPFSREQVQPVLEQAAGKKELPETAIANHNLNTSAENYSTDKISTFNDNTSENYRIVRAAELYQQIIENQQQKKEEKVGQTPSRNSNNSVENLEEAAMNSGADNYDKVVILQLEIERLKERIESGLSDSDYDYYMQLESPVFVLQDNERLEAYQKILDEMLLDMTQQ
ncbi:MAG: hypothetical protein ACWGOD_10090 [Desulfobulbales bacterium]